MHFISAMTVGLCAIFVQPGTSSSGFDVQVLQAFFLLQLNQHCLYADHTHSTEAAYMHSFGSGFGYIWLHDPVASLAKGVKLNYCNELLLSVCNGLPLERYCLS